MVDGPQLHQRLVEASPDRLGRLHEHGRTAGAGAAAPAPDEPGGQPVLDLARMRILEELRTDGISFLERTASSFLARVGDQLAVVRQAVEAGDATALTQSAHALKGSALNLGLPRVGAVAQRLESRGDSGRTEGASALVAELAHEVEIAGATLRAAGASPPRTA